MTEAVTTRVELLDAAYQWKAQEEAEAEAKRNQSAAERRAGLEGEGRAIIDAYKARKEQKQVDEMMKTRQEVLEAEGRARYKVEKMEVKV